MSEPRPSAAVPAPGTGQAILLGFAVIALTVGGIGGWSATAPLASAVIAPGVVAVEGHRKQVQHLEGGIVERIYVRDGQAVAAGEILLRLDDARPRASLGVIRNALDAARVLEARLMAERDGEPLRFPPALEARRGEITLAEMMRAQEVLFEARRVSFAGQQSILGERVAQYEKQIIGLAAQQRALERQIALADEELRTLRALFAKQLVQQARVLAMEREAARLEGGRGERIAEIARAEVAISGTRLEMLQLQRTFRESVVKEIRDVQTQIADLEERAAAARSLVERVEIRAPVSGTVVGLTVHTVGGVIKPSETVLEIVPADLRLVVEAEVQPTDIDNAAAGMDAEVRLTAFKQRTTPTLAGRVAYISADRLTDERRGRSYYLARIAVPDEERARLGPLALQPGMPAEVLIKTRERTALDYLLQPLLDAFARAWRED